jgi:hypothetical protein
MRTIGKDLILCLFIKDCFFRKNERNFALLDYEQAHEIDTEDESIKDRISKVYYEFGVDKYNEKLYEV